MKFPTTPSFYKHTTEPSDYWAVGRRVVNKNFELLIENHEEYNYPVDGWEYHATPPAAFVIWHEENFPPDPIEIE
jgi:hypothetical protein